MNRIQNTVIDRRKYTSRRLSHSRQKRFSDGVKQRRHQALKPRQTPFLSFCGHVTASSMRPITERTKPILKRRNYEFERNHIGYTASDTFENYLKDEPVSGITKEDRRVYREFRQERQRSQSEGDKRAAPEVQNQERSGSDSGRSVRTGQELRPQTHLPTRPVL